MLKFSAHGTEARTVRYTNLDIFDGLGLGRSALHRWMRQCRHSKANSS